MAKTKTPNAIGDKRLNFYVPGNTQVQLYLQIVLIKKPTEEELALVQSELSSQIPVSSRVVLNEIIPVTDSYVRELMDDAGVQVIATQNSGVQRKIVNRMAQNAAETVRDLILYAF